ncbi:MAG: universal stress protein [bacterium]|jgi:nucleotide-binding universal stress UspA family protein|nr:universal stress protein [Betaproteobacteria bacterium]
MKPGEPILAATDLSAPARHAVERACLLAARQGSALHVVHALKLDALDALRELFGANLATVRAGLEADARQRLDPLVADAGRAAGITATARVLSGTPLAAIAREADALDAGLVVLGARGLSFLRHAVLGTTAARLLRTSGRRPVLMVRQAPRGPYRTALVAVDFSPMSRALIEAARRWAPGASLVLLHAFELPYEALLSRAGIDAQEIARLLASEMQRRRDRLRDLAAEAGLTALDHRALVVHGEPAQRVIAMEQECDADLIVLGKHGTQLTEELLLGSVTRQVLDGAQGDVLVVSDTRRGEAHLP